MPTPSRITHDLLDALHQPDCPVCRLVERDVVVLNNGIATLT